VRRISIAVAVPPERLQTSCHGLGGLGHEVSSPKIYWRPRAILSLKNVITIRHFCIYAARKNFEGKERQVSNQSLSSDFFIEDQLN
jgi:hypothetical protein